MIVEVTLASAPRLGHALLELAVMIVTRPAWQPPASSLQASGMPPGDRARRTIS
ncbi:MAG: hypothetical protein ABIS31_06495 [Candidatus Eisenbacteria bacterium]